MNETDRQGGATSSAASTPGDSPDQLSDGDLAQAEADLDRFADAVAAADPGLRFVVVSDLVEQEGDWEADNGENNKRALAAHAIVFARDSPAGLGDTPAQASWPDIAWADGTTTSLPAQSAADTGRNFGRWWGHGCEGCSPLEVTGASPATMLLETNLGQATVPAWRYTLAGTRVALLVAALPAAGPITVTPPTWDPDHPPTGISIDGVAVANRETHALTAEFTGSPGDALQSCGADYTATAVESDLAVVIVVTESRNQAEGGCRAVGAFRTARAQLVQPLGTRAVLEFREGRPVPVVLSQEGSG